MKRKVREWGNYYEDKKIIVMKKWGEKGETKESKEAEVELCFFYSILWPIYEFKNVFKQEDYNIEICRESQSFI